MAGNTFGKIFTLTTFGESHGPAYGCIIDGCPPGLDLAESDLQQDLDKRKPGTSSFTSQRREDDQVEILSGVFDGKTTGTPIGLMIKNTQARASDYTQIKDKFRPGHADFTYQKKYGIRDYRGGGRASARETMMRVAAGAIARKFLHLHCGIKIRAYLAQMGDVICENLDWEIVSTNPFFCGDADKIPLLENKIRLLRREGNSIGARINIVASAVPCGLGEPVFDRLDAELAHALMSINAVKGVEIGAGFNCVTQLGSEHRDEIMPTNFLSNHAGGILGGISSGQDILMSVAFKPAASILLPAQTIDLHQNPTLISTTGRHDPCVGLRGVPVCESMVALVLMDHLLRDHAQNNAFKN